MHRASDSILRNPVLLLIALCAAQIALWTSVPAIVDRALPLDVVELTMWGREWVLLSYKHPQLPSWALEIARWLTDSAGWSAYLVSQLFVTATFILVFLLGRDLVGARGSIAGTLMLTGVYYFSWPTPEFNHNVAQMPIWVAAIFLVWRAVSTGRLFWWIGLALCAAAGLYTKFSMILVIALTSIWLLVDPMARSRLKTAGPWIGLLLFFAAISPLAGALVDMNYLPLEYAAARSEMQARNPIEFVLAQLADHAGLFAILVSASLARTAPDGDASSGRSHIAPRALAFLLYFSLAPLLAMIVLASVSGAKDMWGAPMYSLSGLLAIALFSRMDAAMRHIALWAAAFLVAVPAAYAIAVSTPSMAKKPMRVQWPQAQIAARFDALWHETTHLPLRIVGGDPWTAGLIGTLSADDPSIYTDLNPTFAPWITAERIRSEGLLVVWQGETAPNLSGLTGNGRPSSTGSESFSWQNDPKRGRLTINYAIVPPANENAD